MSLPPRHPSSPSNVTIGTNDGSVAALMRNSSTPSDGSANQGGIRWVEHQLRSVLSHEFAIPLCFLMRDGNLTGLPTQHDLWNYDCEDEPLAKVCDDVFRLAFEKAYAARPKKKDKVTFANMEEVALTNAIHDQLVGSFANHFTSKKQDVVMNPSKSLEGNTEETGKIDISLSHQDGSPLLVMEVGLSHKDWWKKLDQNVQYARAKARNCDKPFLFGVLTMQNQDDGQQAVNINLGVFLVQGIKKKKKEEKMIRACLINRRSVRGLPNCTKAFGKVIFACLNMIKWSKGGTSAKFSYLGPNCCKVETTARPMVLRSYDSRCRATQRSWGVYESLVSLGVAGGRYFCDKLFEMKDGKTDDGVVKPSTDDVTDDGVLALFKYEGCLTVIAVPYFEGGHVAKEPACFVGPVDDMLALNGEGLAHADMRCSNMVHSDDGKFNCVIDYDFAGKINEGEYPKNFNLFIQDGSRADNLAEAGKKLSKAADWYALGYVIFKCYKWSQKGDLPEISHKWLTLHNYFTHDVLESDEDDIDGKVEELKEFLSTANSDWAIKPTGSFKRQLKSYASPAARDSTEDATGSPPKQQAK